MSGPQGPLVFHLVPHTHWDREWYLTAAGFRARLVPVLDDLLEQLAADPAYRSFLLDGQTVLLTDYLSVRPEREPLVRALAEHGRLQTGPWYVLTDLLIPSGEALVRNLLLGARDAQRFGGALRTLYAPDMFGHPAVLPALAREFGLENAALWRGLDARRTNGHDLVRWSAPDGREVPLYHLPPDGYEVGAALGRHGSELAPAWARVRASLVARAATRHVAVLVGADHHSAHPTLPALREAVAALELGHEVRISRLDEFLAAAAAEGADFPAIDGELRWSYGYTWTLQGVHGTRAAQKRRATAAELLLERSAEPLAALARLAGGRDERPLLAHAWRLLVECQFHDAIGGCASDEVARDVDARLAAVEAIGRELLGRSLFAVAGHDPDAARAAPERTEPLMVVWNPAARPRGGVVTADITCFRRDVLVGPPGGRVPRRGHGEPPRALVAADGTALPLQVLERAPGLERTDAPGHYPDLDEVERVRVAFMSPRLPGLVAQRFAGGARPPAHAGPRVVRRGRTLSNRFLEVTAELDGTLSISDRLTGERYPGVCVWESEPDLGDTYTPYVPDEAPRYAAGPARISALADGPLLASLELHLAVPAGRADAGEGTGWVDLRMVVMLLADDPVVRLRVELQNAGRDHRLRLRCPVGIGETEAIAGAAFGVERRPPVRAADTAAERVVPTAPAHRFVAAAAGARGLALFAPGFFEYEWTVGGELVFTALRAVGALSRGDLPSRPGHAGWTMPTPLAQSLGPDRFDLALAPLGAAALARPDQLLALWEDTFLPLRCVWLRHASPAADEPRSRSVELEGVGLVVTAVKPAEHEDGVALRCCNVLDRPTSGVWRFGWPLEYAARVRADEREAEPINLEADRQAIRFTVGARGIATVIVR